MLYTYMFFFPKCHTQNITIWEYRMKTTYGVCSAITDSHERHVFFSYYYFY
uniref:Uncharacterized protein n=1 Tax=Setaria italica TaxID=4555 RepID=K3XP95_SETIT